MLFEIVHEEIMAEGQQEGKRRPRFNEDEIQDLVSYIPRKRTNVFQNDINVKHLNMVEYACLRIISEIFRYDFDLSKMERYDSEIPGNIVLRMVLRRIIAHLLTVAKQTVKLNTMLFRIFFDKFPSREFMTATVTKSDMTVDRIFKELNSHLQSNDDILLDGRWSGTMTVMRLVLDKRKKKTLGVRNNKFILGSGLNYNLTGNGRKKFNDLCENRCLARVVLLSISMNERSELWKAFLAGYDRYLNAAVL